MKSFVIAFAALIALSSAVEFDRPCRFDEMRPRVIEDFQVEDYLGLWYEIYRYEAQDQFELDCVTARYALLEDNGVEVRNAGWSPAGVFFNLTGRADVSDEGVASGRGQLQVSFFPGRKSRISFDNSYQ